MSTSNLKEIMTKFQYCLETSKTPLDQETFLESYNLVYKYTVRGKGKRLLSELQKVAEFYSKNFFVKVESLVDKKGVIKAFNSCWIEFNEKIILASEILLYFEERFCEVKRKPKFLEMVKYYILKIFSQHGKLRKTMSKILLDAFFTDKHAEKKDDIHKCLEILFVLSKGYKKDYKVENIYENTFEKHFLKEISERYTKCINQYYETCDVKTFLRKVYTIYVDRNSAEMIIPLPTKNKFLHVIEEIFEDFYMNTVANDRESGLLQIFKNGSPKDAKLFFAAVKKKNSLLVCKKIFRNFIEEEIKEILDIENLNLIKNTSYKLLSFQKKIEGVLKAIKKPKDWAKIPSEYLKRLSVCIAFSIDKVIENRGLEGGTLETGIPLLVMMAEDKDYLEDLLIAYLQKRLLDRKANVDAEKLYLKNMAVLHSATFLVKAHTMIKDYSSLSKPEFQKMFGEDSKSSILVCNSSSWPIAKNKQKEKLKMPKELKTMANSFETVYKSAFINPRILEFFPLNNKIRLCIQLPKQTYYFEGNLKHAIFLLWFNKYKRISFSMAKEETEFSEEELIGIIKELISEGMIKRVKKQECDIQNDIFELSKAFKGSDTVKLFGERNDEAVKELQNEILN